MNIRFQCAVILIAEKGTLSLPLHPLRNDGALMNDNNSNNNNNNNNNDHPLTTLNFVGLHSTLENSILGQALLIGVKTVRAEGVDHPRSPSSISLLPLVADSNDRDNLSLLCQRRKPVNITPYSEV
jgi:hypothetical protein